MNASRRPNTTCAQKYKRPYTHRYFGRWHISNASSAYTGTSSPPTCWSILEARYWNTIEHRINTNTTQTHNHTCEPLTQVKVTDFGVSAALNNSIAMCGTFVGTFKVRGSECLRACMVPLRSFCNRFCLQYMSPERIQSQPYSYSSDLWSLGLVLVGKLLCVCLHTCELVECVCVGTHMRIFW